MICEYFDNVIESVEMDMQCGSCTTPLESLAGVTLADVSLTEISADEIPLHEGIDWYTADLACPVNCGMNYLAHDGSTTNFNNYGLYNS